MANAVEITENAIGSVNNVNTTFYTTQPYLPNFFHVFLNGILVKKINDDGWIETDPANKVFNLKEAPLEGDQVDVLYLNPAVLLPINSNSIHISHLTPGMVLKIIVKSGFKLNYTTVNSSGKRVNVTQRDIKRQGYNFSNFYANLMENDPQNGKMRVYIIDYRRNNSFEAIVPYSQILHIYKLKLSSHLKINHNQFDLIKVIF